MRGAGSGCPGEVEQRRQRLAKPLTAGNDVEVGRRPVFQQRRAAVPALAPIQLLEVAAAGATAGDHVAGVLALGLKALEEIGRASCRERVEVSVGAVSSKKNGGQ